MHPAHLLPGDVLLYRPSGIYGWMIRFHTGFRIAHVEVYMGSGVSVASRDGLGVGMYKLRQDKLAYVLRPKQRFDSTRAAIWYFRIGKGQPYGWLDLLQFCGYNVNGEGMVCSPCATYVLRAGGIDVFGDVKAEKITPADFLLTEKLERIWSDGKNGDVKS